MENFTSKNCNFSDKKTSDIFHMSAQNIGGAVPTSTHNLCFEHNLEKIMYTPVNLSITI